MGFCTGTGNDRLYFKSGPFKNCSFASLLSCRKRHIVCQCDDLTDTLDSPHSVNAVVHPQIISKMFFAQKQQQVAVDLRHLELVHDVLFDRQLQQAMTMMNCM